MKSAIVRKEFLVNLARFHSFSYIKSDQIQLGCDFAFTSHFSLSLPRSPRDRFDHVASRRAGPSEEQGADDLGLEPYASPCQFVEPRSRLLAIRGFYFGVVFGILIRGLLGPARLC